MIPRFHTSRARGSVCKCNSGAIFGLSDTLSVSFLYTDNPKSALNHPM